MSLWPRSNIVFVAIALVSLAAQSQGVKNILVLHTESSSLPANAVATKAIQEVLGSQRGYEIFEEYLDENRLGTNYQAIAESIRQRYAGRKIDLVLTFGPQAFTFLRLYGEELWPATPKVFSGIETRELPPVLPPNTTGVAGSFNFSSSVDLALQLQPGTRHVFYIGGAAPQELGRRAIAEQDFKIYEGRLDFTYLNSLPLPQILDRVAQLPSHSIVLFTTFFKDASGQAYVPVRICPSIVGSSNSPVYGAFETLLGCGIVGGGLFNIEANVRQAANLGLRIAKGEPVADLPVEQGPPNKLVVDWRQLERWHIPESRLPAGAIVLYREANTWERYKKYILIGAAVFIAQLGLIILLIVQMRRRKRSDLTIRRLTRRLIHAGEDERRHIARELHDDIGQRLSLVSVQLDSLNRRPAPGSSDNKYDLNDSLLELDTLISDVHDLSHRLHSSKLEHLGLGTALAEMCQQVSQRNGLQIDLRTDGLPLDLRRDVSLCFYRIAQEALNNVVKHSCASRVDVRLAVDNGLLRMRVQDFGTGFNKAAVPVGLGLVTMEERLRTITGTLAVVSKAGEGTIVTAEAPATLNKPFNGKSPAFKSDDNESLPQVR